MKLLTRALSFLFACASLHADVVLSPLFSDHAVLQAADKVPVWGRADADEAVRVTLGSAQGATKAGSDGRWRVELDLRKTGEGPFELVAEGRNRVVSADVLVGQVWLCSGQSNMEWTLKKSAGGAEEIAQSSNPRLRQFLSKRVASPSPLSDVEGTWVVASPATAGDFTAVGYHFGKQLQRELRAPIGLINASWGGTPVEAWTRVEAYQDAALKAGAEKSRVDADRFKAFLADYRAWNAAQGREDRSPASPDKYDPFAGDPAGWSKVSLPGFLDATGARNGGAVWIARKITLPAGAVGSGLQIFFGDVRDSVKLYWNGVPVGSGGVDSTMHRYGVNAKNVTATEGVLSARIFNPSTGLGIAPGSARFRIDYKGGALPLSGEWLAKAEAAFPAPAAGAAAIPERPAIPRPDSNVAGYLYDGMIKPLMPAALAGVIWYQGEHNWDRGWQYRTAFTTMITDWRRQWGHDDLPFYFCQLPNYGQPPAKPGESNWAEVRESQAAALALPHTGMAVLIDLGEAGDIHPADKRSVGERLSRIALAQTYGRKLVFAGPTIVSHKIEGAKIRIKFTSAEGGLVARADQSAAGRPASAVQGFAICGADKRWAWAEAKIEGGSVVVWSAEVPAPVAVRYAWADNPVCNLYNASGLPAAPFRTDDFPPSSLNSRY